MHITFAGVFTALACKVIFCFARRRISCGHSTQPTCPRNLQLEHLSHHLDAVQRLITCETLVTDFTVKFIRSYMKSRCGGIYSTTTLHSSSFLFLSTRSCSSRSSTVSLPASEWCTRCSVRWWCCCVGHTPTLVLLSTKKNNTLFSLQLINSFIHTHVCY